MSRTLKLLLIEPDPIFRIGLRVVIEQFSDLEVAAEAETSDAALQMLAEVSGNTDTSPTTIPAVNLVVLEVRLNRFQPSQLSGLQLCRQLKTQYPNLPILLLSCMEDPTQLAAARASGVDGYCPKGMSVAELVAAIRQVAAGRSYWVEEPRVRQRSQVREPEVRSQNHQLIHTSQAPGILAIVRNHLRLSGLQQIDATLAEATARLQVPGLSALERAFLAGHRRELLASRWLVNQLLPVPRQTSQESELTLGVRDYAFELQPNANESLSPPIRQQELSLKSLQFAIFKSIRAKLQFSLENLTGVPLEIDIFREENKRELFELILQKTEDILDELRFSQVSLSQLPEIQYIILRDLWQAATIDFFGRYFTLQVEERNLEIVNILLQDALIVQTAILNKIPLVVDLFSYLLFKTPLLIDNVSYPADSPEAMARAEILLQNLVIQIANGVVQPLLNRLADVEAIKQSFYDRRLISTREIERFRNNLSWKYRLQNSILEPKAIFESRYEIFVLANRGIAKISIYAPRNQELAKLSGIRLAVTLGLETRDAIAPRIRAVVAFLGRSVVYILTQVVGRAIGLIGRGILQGLGGSLADSKFGRKSERFK